MKLTKKHLIVIIFLNKIEMSALHDILLGEGYTLYIDFDFFHSAIDATAARRAHTTAW